MADGMRVTILADRTSDSQTAVIGHDGHFEFASLPTGKYGIVASVRGYRLQNIEATIDRDIDDFAIALDPAGSR
jgi:hypothetical protein